MEELLEEAQSVEWEEAEGGWTDDATEWYGAESVAGIVGMGAFAVVAADENFAFRHDGVDFAGCVGFWAVLIGYIGGFVGVESVGVFVVVYCKFAVFDGDAFAGEGDNALDDILVFDARGRVAGEDFVVATVGKNDDLAALRDIFVTGEVRHSDRNAIDDDTIVGV